MVAKSSSTSSDASSQGIRRVPGIRGLRGLAVGAVVIYHFFAGILPGGYLGVDLFFVLSGFLITSLILREFTVTNRIGLKDFWVRRLRRIVPAAVTVLVVASAFAGLIGADTNVHLARQFFSSLFFVNNWVQIANSQSYFADSELPIFAHYWSLSIEEQFYILWPLLLFVLLRWRGKRIWVRNVAVVLAVASAVWMGIRFIPGEDPTRVYYGTESHAFGLLIGAALSAMTVSASSQRKGNTWSYATRLLRSRRAWAWIGPVALLAQIACFLWLDDQATLSYRGGIFVSSLISACLIATVVRQAGIVNKLFSTRIMQWIGDRSFSIYLWHVPVHVFLQALNRKHEWGLNPTVVGILAVVITCAASHASYLFIEEPFRKYGYMALLRGAIQRLRSPRRHLRATLAAGISAIMVALCGTALAQAPQETQMQRDLEALAKQQQQADQPEKAGELDQEEDREMPSGDEITAIGDSVLLAASDALREAFPGIYIDGEVSRHYEAAEGLIQQLEAQDALDPFVFLSFGTNGQAFEGQLDDLIELLGEDRVIILTMPYGDRWYMAEAQQQVIDAAEKYDNVYAMNWCGFVSQDPSVLREDGIHPGPEGAAGFVATFRDTLQQWVDDDKEIPAVCGP